MFECKSKLEDIKEKTVNKETDNIKDEEETVKKAKAVKKVSTQKSLAESIRPVVFEEEKVGKLFYNERMKRDLELAEIAGILRIRRVHLEAIENGNYDELPAQPYSTGFVSSYAKFLGLNVSRMTQLFKEEVNVKPENKGIFMVEELASEASVPSKRYFVIGLMILIVISLLWGAVYGIEKYSDVFFVNEIEENTVTVDAPEVKFYETSEVAEVVEAQPSQVVITEESFVEDAVDEPKQTGIEVRVVSQDTWVEVKDRKRIYINKVLRPGESYQIPQGSGMIMSVGKDDVEVLVNGVVTPVVKSNKKTNISLDKFLENANH